MVTAKKGPAQAGLLADRPSSGDFNPPPHGYTVNSTSTIVYEIWYEFCEFCEFCEFGGAENFPPVREFWN